MADRPPLALSDDELRIVHDYAKPLLPGLQGKFLERVADLLHSERELGDGVIARACRTAQKEVFDPPLSTQGRS